MVSTWQGLFMVNNRPSWLPPPTKVIIVAVVADAFFVSWVPMSWEKKEKSETQEILSLKPTVKAPEQMASQTKTSLPTINFQGQNCWLRFKEGEKTPWRLMAGLPKNPLRIPTCWSLKFLGSKWKFLARFVRPLAFGLRAMDDPIFPTKWWAKGRNKVEVERQPGNALHFLFLGDFCCWKKLSGSGSAVFFGWYNSMVRLGQSSLSRIPQNEHSHNLILVAKIRC